MIIGYSILKDVTLEFFFFFQTQEIKYLPPFLNLTRLTAANKGHSVTTESKIQFKKLYCLAIL